MSCHRRTNNTNNMQRMIEGGGEKSSPGGGNCGTARPLFNGRDSGRAMPASSGLAPRSSTALHKTSSISLRPNPQSNSCLTGLIPPNVQGGVSLDSLQQQPQHMPTMDQQNQHINRVVQQQKQQEKSKTSSGGQHDDVVECIPSTQFSSDSLDVDPDEPSTNEHQVDRTEFDSLLVLPTGGGMWGGNELQSELLGPLPPPQPVHPPLAGWSFDFDSSHRRETVDGDSNGDKTVITSSDVDTSPRSPETQRTAAPVVKSLGSSESAGSSADAGAGSWQKQGVYQNQPLITESMLPLEKVMIEPSTKVSV